MRQSQLLLPTLREAPSEAEAVSHQLMLRAGLIRQLAAGIYTYLPLGRRVLRRLETIIREEMDKTGAQEIWMPAMQPADLWRQSGRYERYGPELVRLRDRHDREFALGPTHEEVITDLMRGEINSYRQLPSTLYQIQTKFRDEKRPRYGLLRGREFLMKDAYSFDESWEGLNTSYDKMYEAYHRIFSRCGLRFRPVEADAGTIGGEGGTHEFMALADIGEDTIAACTHCQYAANLEKASYRFVELPLQNETSDIAELEKIYTPNARKIEELVQSLNIPSDHILKTLLFQADGKPVAVVVRGDHEVNEIKLAGLLKASELELVDQATAEQLTGAKLGFAGPIGLSIPVIVDYAAAQVQSGLAGANETDFHWKNVRVGIHFQIALLGDIRNAVPGDGCPNCTEGQLQMYRGIEVGQVFKLGTKYSEAMNASFLDAEGVDKPIIMGCYGIGISRVMSAVVEQHYDEQGIRWPLELAPYQVHIVPVSAKDETQMKAAAELYGSLIAAGIEVLLDDRDERAGVKFKDSDLIGIPVRIVVGRQAAEGVLELKYRHEKEAQQLSSEEVLAAITNFYRSK
ncbi:proline--tRNA ligase [Paenibacillus glycanilyticus]|uniref:Proline--tRNA ligase n=1 Tax=Paenibacillus glycanilyticus TaxID=126569 RepID=A0ABQ6GFG4_9BACL|nr:proline--tRNA ligase [Paenibacillus glycanilyticus]GLX68346.1 proline--tRNA ligase [Paenibacillus glycanilyticus]